MAPTEGASHTLAKGDVALGVRCSAIERRSSGSSIVGSSCSKALRQQKALADKKMSKRLLVKCFSQKRHADQMRAGLLFARRLKWFRRTEAGVRADENEGAILYEGAELSVRADDGEWHRLDLSGPVRHNYPAIDNLHVFCMTGFRLEEDAEDPWEAIEQIKQQVEESRSTLDGFGMHAVTLLNGEEFLKRVAQAAEREGIPQWRCEPVEYYDSYPVAVTIQSQPTFKPVFLKHRSYALEREYRLAFNTETEGDDPLCLDIGDISDISTYGDAGTLSAMEWRVSYPCLLCGGRASYNGFVYHEDVMLTYGEEYRKCQRFSCDRCGVYDVTDAAGTLLNGLERQDLIALGLAPRELVRVEWPMVDVALVKKATEGLRTG